MAQSPLHPSAAHTLSRDGVARRGRRAHRIALASVEGGEQSNGFSFGRLGSCLKGEGEGGRSPLASDTRLEVEETDLARSADASRHVGEAAAAARLKVAFARIP